MKIENIGTAPTGKPVTDHDPADRLHLRGLGQRHRERRRRHADGQRHNPSQPVFTVPAAINAGQSLSSSSLPLVAANAGAGQLLQLLHRPRTASR